jgi:hypothetical protein
MLMLGNMSVGQRRQRTEDRNQKCQHDERVGPLEGYLNNPHANSSSPAEKCCSRIDIIFERKIPRNECIIMDGLDRADAVDRMMSPRGDERCVAAPNMI